MFALLITMCGFLGDGFPGLASNAWAQSYDYNITVAESEGVSLDQAVAQVQAETGGRVLAAEVTSIDGRTTYRIKVLLQSGRVKIYYVDAVSGQKY